MILFGIVFGVTAVVLAALNILTLAAVGNLITRVEAQDRRLHDRLQAYSQVFQQLLRDEARESSWRYEYLSTVVTRLAELEGIDLGTFDKMEIE